jgi:hypothetical protein
MNVPGPHRLDLGSAPPLHHLPQTCPCNLRHPSYLSATASALVRLKGVQWTWHCTPNSPVVSRTHTAPGVGPPMLNVTFTLNVTFEAIHTYFSHFYL